MGFLKFNSTIQLRLILLFITTMATMSVTPYLVIYFSTQVGTLITGFMFLGVMIATVVGSFLGGYVSDKIGRKKVIVLAETIVFIGFICAAVVNSPWFNLPYVTFLLFVLIHLSTGAAEPVYQALIIDISDANDRKLIYTYSYWLRNLAAAIGAMAGAFLFYEYHFYLFIGVALFTLLSLILTIMFIKETYKPVQTTIHRSSKVKKSTHILDFFSSYRSIMKHKSFVALAIANLFILSAEEQLTNLIGIRLINEIDSPVQIISFFPFEVDGMNLVGILKSENTILVVCLTIVVSYIMQHVKDRAVLISGVFLYFIGYTIISFSNMPLILLLAMFIASIGELMHIPVKQTLLANMVPDDSRSTYMAFYSITSIVGVSTAGLFIIISKWIETYMISTIIGLMGVLSMILLVRITRSDSVETSNQQLISKGH
ncbi:MFS transporter [Bacillus solimangrovi]|uniref:MFS transporter n=1 Tax=Bacillus solimangrovi TaxID=1305675 RepID=UPI0009F31CD3|nr:MFS transporter [Bacillus solimangrovi]